MMKKYRRSQVVYIALSGGVDSAVAAALLLERGYHVVPVFMKCWSPESAGFSYAGECPWEQDQKDAIAICEKLGIAKDFRTWNFEREYFENVLQPALAELERGLTPNPDDTCNKAIKFGKFFERAIAEGADYVATGHYARVTRNPAGEYELRTAEVVKTEPKRDQTYFLWRISPSELARTLFPVGEFASKAEVKQYADRLDLMTADGKLLSTKPSTRGLCFVGKHEYNDFLEHMLPTRPGSVVTRMGEVVGEHRGVYFYTLGQRKNIGLRGGYGMPYYVVEKDIENNQLIVGMETELWQKELSAREIHWISGKPPHLPLRACTAIRHPQQDLAAPCLITQTDADTTQTAADNYNGQQLSAFQSATVRVTFDDEQRNICPGQSVVFYDEHKEVVLGGGIIH